MCFPDKSISSKHNQTLVMADPLIKVLVKATIILMVTLEAPLEALASDSYNLVEATRIQMLLPDLQPLEATILHILAVDNCNHQILVQTLDPLAVDSLSHQTLGQALEPLAVDSLSHRTSVPTQPPLSLDHLCHRTLVQTVQTLEVNNGNPRILEVRMLQILEVRILKILEGTSKQTLLISNFHTCKVADNHLSHQLGIPHSRLTITINSVITTLLI